VPRWPFLDHPAPLAFAHRGGAGDWPENTMPAFEHAVGLGYRYLETDVHATADGVLLAFHDDHLDRVTDRTGEIAALPYAEVAKARVDGREPIPLLEDLLGAFPEVRVNIDPKHDASLEPLISVLRRTDAVDRVCIGSFSDERLRRLRVRLGAGLCTAMGPKAVARLRLDAVSGTVRPGPAGCVQIPETMRGVVVTNAAVVRAAHRAGLQVHVWTVDDPAAMHRLFDLGVDGIMTDRPAVLKQVLEDRGQWVGAEEMRR
jgi:glycerophosphoryl diester phosphodiesterase